MNTTIGQALRGARARLAVVTVTGAAVLALDLVFSRTYYIGRVRLILAAVALLVYAPMVGWDRASLGWTLVPRQGWLYWAKVAFVLGGIVVAFAALVFGGAMVLGIELQVGRLFSHPSQVGRWLVRACLIAPILEEAMYRLVLCVPASALTRPWVAIFASGAAFGGVHFIYGNPAPDNFIAGFLLGWAYLKSDCLLVPVVLHALGNLCVGLMYVGICYWGL